RRARAAAKPSARVGSPPSRRVIAAATSAVLKKITTAYWQKETSKPASSTTGPKPLENTPNSDICSRKLASTTRLTIPEITGNSISSLSERSTEALAFTSSQLRENFSNMGHDLPGGDAPNRAAPGTGAQAPLVMAPPAPPSLRYHEAPVAERPMAPDRPVALVTGAAKRIGATIARRLHADGYDLALHYRSSKAEMDALVAELESTRAGSTLALQAELAEFDRLPELVAKTVGHFGRLDGLVNNASA